MKGIILAGGSGTRLYPATNVISKQLLPIADKPMIYYPLSTLLLAGLKEILVISTPQDLPHFQRLLGDGSNLGVSFSYAEQPSPDGLAQAFIIGRKFLEGQPACLILGDNIFHRDGLSDLLLDCAKLTEGAMIFGYQVNDPARYGVIEFGPEGRVLSIEEKPAVPKSNFAAVGLYFYDGEVCDLAESVVPSSRNELEITDLNKLYLDRGTLFAKKLGRGTAWLDTGTHESLLQASNFVTMVEERQNVKIGCLEEIAYRYGYIDQASLAKTAEGYGNSSYGHYLRRIAAE